MVPRRDGPVRGDVDGVTRGAEYLTASGATDAEHEAEADMGEDDPAEAVPKRPRARRKAASPSPVAAQAMELAVHAPRVIEDGASLAGDQVALYRSAVGRVEGRELRVDQGAVGAARVEHLSMDRGVAGAVLAGDVEVRRSYVRSILARQVQLDRGAARVVIAADVRAERSAVMFLIARRVSGEMRVLLDWRGALAFGAAAGLVIALLSRVRRRRA
jgi:hypothetical protein